MQKPIIRSITVLPKNLDDELVRLQKQGLTISQVFPYCENMAINARFQDRKENYDTNIATRFVILYAEYPEE